MVEGIPEIAAMCIGLVGLIGAAATTGMPMWKVTAFIGENIIVMETRWEGLWMNCYRQANIRMQCKVYDSLLFLPAELQAARGLMCCSVALSGLGLMIAMLGLRCTSCFQGNKRAKNVILSVAGGMQLLACVCVFIPVSWTGHVIIRDFYNPLLIDAQRRELGDALYIGWVTGAVLFCSALLFICSRQTSDKRSNALYHPPHLLGYNTPPRNPNPMMYQPISSVSSLRSNIYQPSLQRSSDAHQLVNPQIVTSDAARATLPVLLNPGRPESATLLYQGSAVHHPSMRSSNPLGKLYTPVNSLYMSQSSAPYTLAYDPSLSYQSSFQPTPQAPVFIPYIASRIEPGSHSGSGAGMYI
ncbi:claudin-8-like [Entelurus aequoreus]|uniref:claudin-8-like n=1 Tax=Entelurus aequoreus TaxID=161455 RepID=UPI002B1DCF28|nr:claudin-8-like [Entelurus aequoreus]